jgi:sugar phosphate permease
VASPYRWAVLAAGTVAQASYSAFSVGLPAIAPALRDAFDLDLKGFGLLIAAGGLGLALALLPWGFVADKIGERRALAFGLAGCGLFLVCLTLVDSFVLAALLLALAGASGASVQSASGRAVMAWFGPEERGLAFGVRQMAVPLGGVVAALVLPALARSHGVDSAFVFLACFCVIGAVVGAVVIREVPEEHVQPEDVEWTLHDRRLWLLSGASAAYVAAQIVTFSFLVLFLHDARGLAPRSAAAALAAVHVLALVLRVAVGRWSDVLRSRVVPLRLIGLASFATLSAAALILQAPVVVVVPLLVTAGAISASWNGLAFVAAAELAGRARSGAAIGFQQTVLGLAAVVVAPVFAAVVQASSWRVGFALAALTPLVGWVMLGRVRV